jgi:hypothetical protein
MTDVHVDHEEVAARFRADFADKLEDEKIDEAVRHLAAAETAYAANAAFASFLFYIQVHVNITGGKSFTGNAGGFNAAGGGVVFGHVYTDDLNRLYSKTSRFWFLTTPVYVHVQFFDSDSNSLGHFEGGGITTGGGTGGGPGSWE